MEWDLGHSILDIDPEPADPIRDTFAPAGATPEDAAPGGCW